MPHPIDILPMPGKRYSVLFNDVTDPWQGNYTPEQSITPRLTDQRKPVPGWKYQKQEAGEKQKGSQVELEGTGELKGGKAEGWGGSNIQHALEANLKELIKVLKDAVRNCSCKIPKVKSDGDQERP